MSDPVAVVDGRKAYAVEGWLPKSQKVVWSVFDREPGNDGDYLSPDGDWVSRGKQFQAPTREAAEEFARGLSQVASQSPAR